MSNNVARALARDLATAATLAGGVDLNSPADFVPTLRAAYESARRVWAAAAHAPFMRAHKRDVMRAIRTLTSILAVEASGRAPAREDGPMLAQAAAALSRVSEAFASVGATVTPNQPGVGFSSTDEAVEFITSDRRAPDVTRAEGADSVGTRMLKSLTSLGDAALDLRHVSSLRDKLPRKVPAGRTFVVTRMPLVVQPAGSFGPAQETELRRTGAKFLRVGSAVAVFDQLVLGFASMDGLLDEVRVSARHGMGKRVVRLGESPRTLGKVRQTVKTGHLSSAIQAVSRRAGVHVNPLQERESPVFRSPGNPLFWVWVASIEVSRALPAKAAAFAWSSAMTPRVAEQVERQHQEELESLTRKLKEANALGKHLSVDDIARISHLREEIDRIGVERKTVDVTSDERKQRFEANKQRAAELLQKHYGPLLADIQEHRLLLPELPASERPAIQRMIRALEKKLDQAKADVMRRMKGA